MNRVSNLSYVSNSVLLRVGSLLVSTIGGYRQGAKTGFAVFF